MRVDRSALTRFRFRLAAACLLLVGLAMTQAPGRIIADTKLDLAIAPLKFLSRATSLWDPQGAFGQLQNQAYGYLWPMGSFFGLGSLVDLPPWVVQRLWLALVLCVAFVGAAKVTRALGVRSDLACVLAGFLFALSPRMLTVLGPSSIEVWPSALVPWVLLPLVLGSERGSPRRAAALSAVAIAMVGGVNAAATAAVLPLGIVWLLTRTAGPRRRQLMLWWPVFTFLGTLWWLVPLVILGAYSPPFLEYIESARVTTATTDLFDALRGTSNWVAYADPQSVAGSELLRETHLIMYSGALLAFGLGGIALRRNPNRRFLVAGLLTGLFLVTLGHLGAAQGALAPQLNDLLDTVLTPVRNVHKFDPIIRLCVVVGVGFAVEEAIQRVRTGLTWNGRAADRTTPRVLIASTVLGVLVTTLPMAMGHVAPRGSFEAMPEYWRDASTWLGQSQDNGVALLVPGSSFGTYVWGEPRDEPLQPLAASPWAVRNAVPLAPAGNIRMLNAIEERLAQGDGGPELTEFLARAGVSHLVVRNDLTRGGGAVDPTLVHQAIEQSTGIERAAEFGPPVGGEPEIQGDLGRALINGGWQTSYAAIEIFEVPGGDFAGRSVETPTTVIGGPENLLDLSEADLIGDDPTILAPDASSQREPLPGQLILTDGLRRVERQFASLHDATSPTLTRDQAYILDRLVPDYELPDQAAWETTAALDGADEIGATSSASDPGRFFTRGPGQLPFAAIDGDPDTAWASAFGEEPQSWWVELPDQVDGTDIAITLGLASGHEELRVRSGDWESAVLEIDPGETRRLRGPETLRSLVIEDASGTPNNQMSLAEVRIGDTEIRRELVLPEIPPTWGAPDAVVLSRLGDARTGCAVVDDAVRCRAGRAWDPEESARFQRQFTLSEAADMPLRVWASPRAGGALDQLTQEGRLVSVETSGDGIPDPRAASTAMVDGNPGTTWVAPVSDISPDITISFVAPQKIRGIAVGVARGTAARRPQSFKLTWAGGSRVIELDDDGTARFPAITTTALTLEVIAAEPATDLDIAGGTSDVPVGIGELRLIGTNAIPVTLPTTPNRLPCGSGPEVEVNGSVIQTSLRISPADLASTGSFEARPCGVGSVQLRAGENTVAVTASDAFWGESVVLGDARPPTSGAVQASGGSTKRSLEFDGSAYVATTGNTNPGWIADDGSSSQVFDGWRQGWRSSGDSELTMRFAPQRVYLVGLVAGGFALVALLVALALTLGGRARTSAPALTESRGGTRWWLSAVVASSLLLAGWIGLIVGVMAGMLGWAIHRWRPTWEGWGLAALLVPAAAAFSFNPWGVTPWAGNLQWPPYFVVAACVGIGCWAVLPLDGVAKRIAGLSKHQ